jgi:D-serine deaminase-like pyridoxal phosphate-dependent protein
MHTPVLGTSILELDTPALLVDLSAVERNIERCLGPFRGGRISVRPHLKTAKSPEFARLLLAAGARGVCVAKLGEAEVLAQAGIADILITTELVGVRKLERLVALLRQGLRIRLVVDSAAGADALNAALAREQLSVEVLLDIDVGQRRCGVLPGAQAVALAQHVASLPCLQLIGLQGYEGHVQLLEDAALREQRCNESMVALASTAQQLRSAGFRIEVVSTGGTGSAELCARHAEVTELQPGSFLFYDTAYQRVLGSRYEHALSVLATVLSRPREREAIVDAGLKSLSTDSGPAEPRALPGVRYRPAGDEHGVLEWDGGCNVRLAIGDRVELLPSHIDTTINLHDTYRLHRDGVLCASWPVAARGRVQ